MSYVGVSSRGKDIVIGRDGPLVRRDGRRAAGRGGRDGPVLTALLQEGGDDLVGHGGSRADQLGGTQVHLGSF